MTSKIRPHPQSPAVLEGGTAQRTPPTQSRPIRCVEVYSTEPARSDAPNDKREDAAHQPHKTIDSMMHAFRQARDESKIRSEIERTLDAILDKRGEGSLMHDVNQAKEGDC